jgi:hypothetical protein
MPMVSDIAAYRSAPACAPAGAAGEGHELTCHPCGDWGQQNESPGSLEGAGRVMQFTVWWRDDCRGCTRARKWVPSSRRVAPEHRGAFCSAQSKEHDEVGPVLGVDRENRTVPDAAKNICILERRG